MFYDVHAHLTSKEFDNDRNILVKKLIKEKIKVVNNGLSFLDNFEVLKLSKNSCLLAAIGMHPTNTYDKVVEKQIMENKERIVAIGEVGLDFKELNNKEEQVKNFKKLIKIAEKINKPLIVHSRNAQKEVLDLIKNVKVPVVLHAFLTKKKLIEQAINLSNTFITISSSADYSEQVRDMIKVVPIEKMFCETDSPYMWKYERNTPLNVIKAYKTISVIKKVSLKTVEKVIENNFKKVFSNDRI